MKIRFLKKIDNKMFHEVVKELKRRNLLISINQYESWDKERLIQHIIQLQSFTVKIMYIVYKSQLPRLRTTRPRLSLSDKQSLKRIKDWDKPFRKTKRKKLTGAAKVKFLARMNKGRRKKGLKPIRSR